MVVTRFVDHAELAVLLGHRVSDGDVKLPTFQRHVLTFILHTNDQHFRGFRHGYFQLQNALDLELSLADAGGLIQCTSARTMSPPARRTRAMPFRLRQRPRP
jgi:hypothetical protein